MKQGADCLHTAVISHFLFGIQEIGNIQFLTFSLENRRVVLLISHEDSKIPVTIASGPHQLLHLVDDKFHLFLRALTGNHMDVRNRILTDFFSDAKQVVLQVRKPLMLAETRGEGMVQQNRVHQTDPGFLTKTPQGIVGLLTEGEEVLPGAALRSLGQIRNRYGYFDGPGQGEQSAKELQLYRGKSGVSVQVKDSFPKHGRILHEILQHIQDLSCHHIAVPDILHKPPEDHPQLPALLPKACAGGKTSGDVEKVFCFYPVIDKLHQGRFNLVQKARVLQGTAKIHQVFLVLHQQLLQDHGDTQVLQDLPGLIAAFIKHPVS